MKRAIVLSGGGARGAYQIGAWKALRKLNIKYDIVTGTSIGSINGLLMVQKDFHKAQNIWKNISFSDIFNENISNDIDTKDLYKKIVSIFLKKGGLETNKIYNLILDNYNEKRFYRSNIDYGIITLNIKKLKPMIIKKGDKKPDLIKYVLASSTCYPAFQITKIDDEMFIDGGYYDNLPINLAIDMGADEIIAIDLDAVGLKKKTKSNKVKIINIKPINDLDSFLQFNKDIASRSILYGYNDVMKKFGKLEGLYYTFYKNNLFNNYNLNYNRFVECLNDNINEKRINNSILNKIKNIRTINQLIDNNIYNVNARIFNIVIEHTGKLLEVDDSKIYSIKVFNKLLIKQSYKYESYSKKYIMNIIKLRKISKLINKRALMLYIYKQIKNDELNENEVFILSTLFTKEFLSAIYLYII